MRLSAWETVTPTFQQRYVNDYLPLERISTNLRIQLVHCLDRAYPQKGLTKSERLKVAGVITSLAGEMVGQDENLKAIYNRYSETDYDSEAAADINGIKSMLESLLGIDLGEDLNTNSPEDLIARARAHLQQQEDETVTRAAHRATRKKSPKQLAAEARAQEEQAQMSLSIREIYRKLASALHPDREIDPQERERKTLLMQRVNDAYNKNNLLQLLELQLELELEHIDLQSLNHLNEDRLKHYNKILKEQVSELDQQILHVESAFRERYGFAPFEHLSPERVLPALDEDIENFWLSIRAFKRDLEDFEDIKNLKHWLRSLSLG
ncbi:J domain-containing protein [Uliginosibacterium gangwonense]|uniref:J domain-containing protein n=1 Tax=Uliginosibacterium gangwonense TaxID=392736 RepID=UPI00036BEEA0|nr:J domain-containing protein [Uliginosibacterium gangwonense]